MNTGAVLLGFIFVALVAAPALAADEPEDDQGPYPIWWSPELGVESLGDVDSELDKPFPTEK